MASKYSEDLQEVFNIEAIVEAAKTWGKEGPFDHMVVDNFFVDDFAKKLEAEFPEFDDELWHKYANPIEIKKVCNIWNDFRPDTYKAFNMLNSAEFTDMLSQSLFGGMDLFSDSGLNGGGWHIHTKGGKLNTHLDYSLHPKLGLQRKLNIIVYMNSQWQNDWGGSLGLWGNESDEAPGKLAKQIEPVFNRAAFFDTTQNSWHGLPDPLTCPDGQSRKSLAVYYLCHPPADVDDRGKALFAPTEAQKSDEDVLDLIKRRADVATASQVYDEKA